MLRENFYPKKKSISSLCETTIVLKRQAGAGDKKEDEEDEKSRTVFEEDVIVAHLETDAVLPWCIIIAFRFYWCCVCVCRGCVKRRKCDAVVAKLFFCAYGGRRKKAKEMKKGKKKKGRKKGKKKREREKREKGGGEKFFGLLRSSALLGW